MMNPRRTAVTALLKQEKNGYSNLVLKSALEKFDGTQRDAAFVSTIFYGTVERQITLDYMLSKCLTKPLNKLDPEIRAILRSGLYQAKYLDSVPAPSAIDESVKLTRKMGKTSAAGMVNAVLRKACSFEISEGDFADKTEFISVKYSVSQPIARLFMSTSPQEYENILSAAFTKPRVCVRVNTLVTTAEKLTGTLEHAGATVTAGSVKNSLYVSVKGDITALKPFKDGCFHVQGESSQLACLALSPKAGEKVLDLCAAPGGKSATLAQYMDNKGELFSCDRAENRLSLIKSLFDRCRVHCGQISQNDAAVYNREFENADCVLCDVPCSGLGVMAKKPDIRLNTLDELPQLIALQKRILETSSRYVKKGGRLVYSTCTLNPDENENNVLDFLSKHSDFKAVKAPNLPNGDVINEKFTVLNPFYTKTDGFFIAYLERLW